jgi:serine/threonine protein kinase
VYQIIYGVAPFMPPRGGDSRDLIQLIETKDVDFPPHLEISPELQDLMKRMLVRNPVDRISFLEIFHHEWLKQGNTNT